MAKNFRTGLIITGDSKGGVRAVRATSSELRRLNQDFETGSKRARTYGNETRETARELEFLKQNALGIGAALAGAFAANNLAQQAAMVRDTDALAQSLQVSTRTLQQWQFAGKQVGLEADKVGDIFKDVSDKVGDFAATGGGEAADLFENLNLNIRELQSLSPDQQILRIAEAINQVEDPSQRAFYFESLADEMVRLQPLLANGAQGLREAADMADALGVAMDDIEVRRAVEAAEAMDQLQGVAQGLSNTLIADLGPGLASNVRSLTEFIDQVGGADEVLEGIGQTVTTLGSVYLAVRLRDPLSKIGPLGLAAGRNIATGFAMAVGASGRLNQALVITQGRIAATAAAGRALRASLALIGGPAGAALLAAGALYTYRDELGLTQDKIGLTEDQLASFRGELADMSQDDLGKSLASLNAELDQATLKAARAREELATLRSESSGSGFLGFEGGEVGERVRGIRAVADAEADIAKIEQKRDAALAERGSRIYKPLTGWLFETESATDSNTESVTRQSQAAKEAAEREKQFASSLATLEDRLFPATAAQRDFLQSQLLLQTGLMKGEIGIDRYLEAWQRLNTERSRNITGGFMERVDTGGLAKEVEETSGAARDLGLTFTSAFEDAAIEGENFRGVLQGIFEDIQRIIIRRSITEPAEDAISGALDGIDLGGLFNFGGGGGNAFAGSYGSSSAGSFMGFAGGGWTGPGGKYQPKGVVHGEEFVVRREVVKQPGVRPMLERLNKKGYANGGYVGGRAMPMASGDLSVHIHNESGEAMQVGRREERRGGDGRRELHLWVNRAVDQRMDQRFADGSLDRTMRNNYGARRQSK
ncbi:hypothetical protein RSO41_12550 [Halomonas sp. I1]|uniref:hypothetical protein n=1 Tax=Halomonas sp. I1 TaxID=393536 RepID=UPI0028E0009A|nr:hypothetical protein [Halomonas sp. I1]MDT8895486.1 hypothetical protein [Halomonas sp. I1]